MTDDLKGLQQRISYQFLDRGLLERALTHKSRVAEDLSGDMVDNEALEFLGEGIAPAEIAETIWNNDPDPGYRNRTWPKAGRQFSVMNAEGKVATFTGPEASDWAGHVIGEYCSAQGNILAGPRVVQDMVTAFENTEGHLSLRLMAALEAGQAAGGDSRGMQSAAMLIVQEDGGVWLNNDVVLRLQVDDSENPILELRRLVDIANQRFGPRR